MVCPLVVSNSRFASRMFYFNLDAAVGPGCPNKPDDVQLVQMGYVAMLRNPAAASVMTPDMKEAFGKIVPGAPYTGGRDEWLSKAIRAHQARSGGTQDGKVSVATSAAYYDKTHSFIVVVLDNNIMDYMPQDYPRLDKSPLCAGALRQSVQLMLLGKSS